MRKQLLGLTVSLLAFVLIAAAADMTGKEVAASARLQRLEVAHSQDGLRVEFRATGTVGAQSDDARVAGTHRRRLSQHRDGDGTEPHQRGHGRRERRPRRHERRSLAEHARGALTWRATTLAGRQHELVAGPDGSFVLKIHAAALAHRQAVTPATKQVAVNAAPQLMPVSASPAALAPAATTTAVTPTPAPAASPERPADFAFIEPKFAPKKDDAAAQTAAADPAAKSQEAASRFADKTAAELVATNSNAAMGQTGATPVAISLPSI